MAPPRRETPGFVTYLEWLCPAVFSESLLWAIRPSLRLSMFDDEEPKPGTIGDMRSPETPDQNQYRVLTRSSDFFAQDLPKKRRRTKSPLPTID